MTLSTEEAVPVFAGWPRDEAVEGLRCRFAGSCEGGFGVPKHPHVCRTYGFLYCDTFAGLISGVLPCALLVKGYRASFLLLVDALALQGDSL